MTDTIRSAPAVPDWLRDLYALVDAGEHDAYVNRYFAGDAEMTFGAPPAVRGKGEDPRNPYEWPGRPEPHPHDPESLGGWVTRHRSSSMSSSYSADGSPVDIVQLSRLRSFF